MSDVIVAPETRDLDELSASLGAWLAGRLGVSAVTLSNLSYPRGAGQSHETILFSAQWPQGSLDGVVRIKPGGFTVFPDDLFEQQYRIMDLMHRSGAVRVAEPLWLEHDEAVLGRPFFVMRQVKGRVPVSIPPYSREGWVKDASPAQRRRLWESGVRQLAAIQSVPVADTGFLAGPDGARDGLAQEWDKYCRFVRWLEAEGADPGYVAVLDKGLARLDACRPSNQPQGIVWGDARLGNMMFDDNFDVVAVMDWEQPSLGGALHDLAWFCEIAETMHGPDARHGAPLDGMGSRAETVALWEEVSGKSAADLEWYADFAKLKMSCTGVRLGLLRGVPPQMGVDQMAARLRVD
ncbi:phosphotransferase family protein [Novosphingobium sp. TH158]|uniref:phosphotransferase family protein n=1 Tax=Novosphingobium sp. TH158 TaxID=2067455 RepID=UPI000C7AD285|nr:phosphotransferase family protein [Novosphingobium sp. TH158]PLK26957.1 phosphotransferase family protein [Novosphingobium sp. TH158]